MELKSKIGLFCNLSTDCVMTAEDVPSIYEVPLRLHEEGIDEKIVELLNIWTRKPELQHWHDLIKTVQNPEGELNIAMVGKYVDLTDAYKSLNEALTHGGIANKHKVNLKFIDSEPLNKDNVAEAIGQVDGIVIPGGFGDRGIEGKIQAIRHARENKIPFLGICLGMQLAVVEFARHVAGWTDANSTEFDQNTNYPVIDLMEDQKKVMMKGATMRLGAYPCTLEKGTFAMAAYEHTNISERHRHRFEFNNFFQKQLEEKGLVISGVCPEGPLVEIIEIKEHPWFLGCQFHPEFRSRPHEPQPLFSHFISAAIAYRSQQNWRQSKSEPTEVTAENPTVVKKKESV